jgi:uncharacterized protein (DUF2336 family)
MEELLDDLNALARERSRERRGELLSRLTDLFHRGAGKNSREATALFEDVICRVLSEVDITARINLSGRMSHTADAPRRVIMALAEDEIPVAEPVLRYSPVLTDTDLVAVANKKTIEHRAVMARRIYVSEQVSEALIARGEPDVHRALAGNDGAQIGPAGFDTLLAGVSKDYVLQELLALRPNLPAAVRQELLPKLAAEVRRRVADKLMAEAEPLIAKALDAEVDAIMDRVDEMSKDRIAYHDLQRAYDEGVLSLDDVLQQACRLNRHEWVIDLIAFAGPLERMRVAQALLERDPKPIAVLLKSHGLSSETFRAVIELRTKHLRAGSNAPKLVDDYAKLDPEVAQSVLRHLRTRVTTAA